MNDFVWWTRLKVSESKEAIKLAKSALQSVTLEGESYWMSNTLPAVSDLSKSIHLSPAYDEFLIAYTDRSASLPPTHFNSIFTKNGISNPTIVHGGKVKATWKRTISKTKVTIDLNTFNPMSPSFLKSTSTPAKKFASFIGKTLEIGSPKANA